MLDSYQIQVTLDTEKSELLTDAPVLEGTATFGEPGTETPQTDGPVIEEIPILPVRDTVLFPHGLLPISVGRPASVALVKSLGENRTIGIVSQLDSRTDSPEPNELYKIGTLVVIHKIVPMREGLLLFCEGVTRLRTIEFVGDRPLSAGARRTSAGDRAGHHATARSLAAECPERFSADCFRGAELIRRDFFDGIQHSRDRDGWRILWPALCRA